MLETGLHALITSDDAFSTLCADRLFPVVLPDNAGLPSVSYQVIATTRKRLLDGSADTTSTLLQFDVWAKRYDTGRQVAATLLSCVEGFTGTLPDGTQVLSCELSGCHDLYETDARLYRVSIDLRITTP